MFGIVLINDGKTLSIKERLAFAPSWIAIISFPSFLGESLDLTRLQKILSISGSKSSNLDVILLIMHYIKPCKRKIIKDIQNKKVKIYAFKFQINYD